ncbi:MAG: YebC/PmpR family DNA-binding transcriptional regulator [Gammaproteobacteria bacterium]|nr:YebC/PmpR family DNA-binding transcriptional regulator [Gammaproteobacteria bacterium]|tara:strand:+ start:1231 stop:1944 length:714 start_codon:yes stop_codon:yes gene_type:complete
MAGHSKWANIQHRKKAQDNKRGKVFTKVIREITVAAKIGGIDSNSNSRLRLALSKANASNVPKDTIKRAIEKASGNNNDNFEEITYEGYGPKGVAIIIECLTDNKNRTVSELRHVLSKHGGSLGTNGSVAHLFRKVGILKLIDISEDILLNHMDDVELLDFEIAEGDCVIFTEPTNLYNIKKYFESKSLTVLNEEVIMDPIVTIDIPDDEIEKIVDLSDKIEDLDDVQNIYMNVNLA